MKSSIAKNIEIKSFENPRGIDLNIDQTSNKIDSKFMMPFRKRDELLINRPVIMLKVWNF